MRRAIICINETCGFAHEDIIKKELSQVIGISNIYYCKRDSFVSFFFNKASHISTVENHLMFLGLLCI